jgi:hypothetical protein
MWNGILSLERNSQCKATGVGVRRSDTPYRPACRRFVVSRIVCDGDGGIFMFVGWEFFLFDCFFTLTLSSWQTTRSRSERMILLVS